MYVSCYSYKEYIRQEGECIHWIDGIILKPPEWIKRDFREVQRVTHAFMLCRLFRPTFHQNKFAPFLKASARKLVFRCLPCHKASFCFLARKKEHGNNGTSVFSYFQYLFRANECCVPPPLLCYVSINNTEPQSIVYSVAAINAHKAANYNYSQKNKTPREIQQKHCAHCRLL